MTNFRFRRNMNVGDLTAERDQLLTDAFLDTGDLSTLVDLSNPKCVVVGRTGAGKSALLRMLEERRQHRLIRLSPQSLSLQYLDGSTIVPVLTNMGIRLNFFWTLFWRHIIALEIIQHHYHIHSQEEEVSFWQKVTLNGRRKNARNERREAALTYVKDWAGEFWRDSDTRTQRLLTSLEHKVDAAVGGTAGGFKANFGSSVHAGQQRESELTQRAQDAVNKLQFQHLAEVLDILREDVLHDPQKPYFIIVDDLDQDWVEVAYAYEMIDALIEEAGTFQRLGNVKVIVALRDNILHQVNTRMTGKRGRQREKAEGLLLRIAWRRPDLVLMMDRRLTQLMRGQYGEKATLKGILPNEPHKGRSTGPALDYVLDRTIQRPRDLIKFINGCIDAAEGRGRIEWQHIFTAERAYSQQQLAALVDEWAENHPDIEVVLTVFREMESPFELGQLENRIWALIELGERDTRTGSICHALAEFVDAGAEPLDVARGFMVPKLFEIAFLGIKPSPSERLQYYFDDPHLISGGIPDGAKIYIHPAFKHVLSIK